MSRQVELLRAALLAQDLSEPAYAVALWPIEEGDATFDPYPVSIGLEPDRQRAIADLDGMDRFERVWNAAEFAIDDIEQAEVHHGADYAAAEAEVREQLERRSRVLDPTRWVLDRVARRLTAEGCLPEITDDFVVFTFDDEFTDELLESIRFALPKGVATGLRMKGLLPPSVDDLLEDSFGFR